MGVLLREFTALYAAFVRGLPDPLAPLPLQYADYSRWQREWLTGPVAETLVERWREALEGTPEHLELPSDHHRPAVPTLRGAFVPWQCPPPLARRLQARARAAGATPFMLLLTAFQALLARWSGVNDLVVGTPVAQRNRAEIEPLIGFFVNTLPLRAQFAPDLTFADALARGRETILTAYTHQDLPFETLVQALRPDRDLSRQPIVQVMFILQNAPMPTVKIPGIDLEPVAMPTTVAKFDLTLSLAEAEDGGLDGDFEYATDLFDLSTIERVGHWFTRILTAIAEDPAAVIADIDLLSAEERRLILSDWNPAPTPFPQGTLPSLFAAQASRTPDAEAVAEGPRALSYAALDRASDAVAAALQQRGVGLETVVGVALARALETVVYALAVLKAGGVYLPLDPAYPPDRLAFMLDDARAALVLTDAATAPRLPISVPQYQPDLTATGTPHPPALEPDHLAYIVYTSGSTGTPKGVAVSHAAAANLAFARRHGHDPIGPGDRVLAAISVGFDVSIGQLLLPLLSGACVVVAPDLRTLSADSFWALIEEGRVSHVNSVPSFFDSVLDAAPPGAGLQRLMLGGEPLTGALCRRLQAALPNTMLVNMYGPTEACIDATAYLVPAQPGDGVMPVGRPLANYRAYVLDAQLRLVPLGVAGELFLGGAGLARGYVGQPDLTAARFLPDPFAPPGGRLYRTGDRAAWRPDGTLAFLGRDDDQVKIRGFRVELGEIVASLRTHPGVAQAAVIVRKDPPGTGRLVAYIVPVADMPAAKELRAHLAERLPSHMIPGVFVALPSLPLTRNGKLDAAALPAPPAETDVAPPVGERETLLCALFAELTGTATVGRHDGFFNLGGDSIGAIRLVSLARTRGSLSIQVRDVFAHPTPAELALVAVTADENRQPYIDPVGALLPTPLQQALLASGAPLGRFHQAVALHPPRGLDSERIENALSTLVAAHPGLHIARTDQTLAVVTPSSVPILQRLTHANPAELTDRVQALTTRFDLSTGQTVAALLATPQDPKSAANSIHRHPSFRRRRSVMAHPRRGSGDDLRQPIGPPAICEPAHARLDRISPCPGGPTSVRTAALARDAGRPASRAADGS